MPHAKSIELAVPRYIPFEPKAGQRAVRDQLRSLLDRLELGPGDVLAASLAGAPPANADIENLLLYNVDESGRRFSRGCGVQFERLPPEPRAPFTYRYAAVPDSDTFQHWSAGSVLASFDGVELDSGPIERLCDRAWLAMRRSPADTAGSRAGGPVALRLRVTLPERGVASPARLVKGLFDGVIAALTRDAGSPHDARTRLAARLAASEAEISTLLASTEPVFGSAQLLTLRGDGIQWQPPDHLLVAGSLRWERGRGSRITLAGDVGNVGR